MDFLHTSWNELINLYHHASWFQILMFFVIWQILADLRFLRKTIWDMQFNGIHIRASYDDYRGLEEPLTWRKDNQGLS